MDYSTNVDETIFYSLEGGIYFKFYPVSFVRINL